MKAFRKHKNFWSFLAFWLLFTTSGFSINEHYCNGILKDITLVVEPGCCEEEAACHSIKDDVKVNIESKTCCKSSSNENQCCSTEYNYIHLDVELSNIVVQSQNTLLLDLELFDDNSFKYKNTQKASFQALNFHPYNFIFVLNKAPLALFQNFLL